MSFGIVRALAILADHRTMAHYISSKPEICTTSRDAIHLCNVGVEMAVVSLSPTATSR